MRSGSTRSSLWRADACVRLDESHMNRCNFRQFLFIVALNRYAMARNWFNMLVRAINDDTVYRKCVLLHVRRRAHYLVHVIMCRQCLVSTKLKMLLPPLRCVLPNSISYLFYCPSARSRSHSLDSGCAAAEAMEAAVATATHHRRENEMQSLI